MRRARREAQSGERKAGDVLYCLLGLLVGVLRLDIPILHLYYSPVGDDPTEDVSDV